MKNALFGASLLTVLTACAVPGAVPVDTTGVVPSALPTEDISLAPVDEAVMSWRGMVVDPTLAQTIDVALSSNKDLAAATANIAIARAQLGASRASFLPSLALSASQTEAGTFDERDAGGQVDPTRAFSTIDRASVQLAVPSYEVDLFGRVSAQTEAARQSLLSQVEVERATKIAVASAVAQGWIVLSADRAFLSLAQETVQVQQESLDLTRELFNAGVATEIDVRRASVTVERAKAQVATFRAQVERDVNALRLLTGGQFDAALVDEAILWPMPVVGQLPADQSSEILLQRPDVRAAERSLLAADANIAAARAAFFPSITLTGSAGYTGTELSGVFDAGGIFSITPQVSLPIFDAGRRRANLRGAEARYDLLLAQYEQSIQTAFRETADALATARTIDNQLAALERLVADAEVALDLSRKRFRVGVDDYLTVLDAQQIAYDAQQQLIAARRNAALNKVDLYQALSVWPEDPGTRS